MGVTNHLVAGMILQVGILEQAQGAKVPGFQRFWLLAAMGGCPIRTKAAAAAAVGAEGEVQCTSGTGPGGGVKVNL